MSKAIVLLSGGQDSTTCLHWALQRYDEVVALSAFYGQRHAVELVAAERIMDLASQQDGKELKHIIADLNALGQVGDSALIGDSKEIEGSGGYRDSQCARGLPTSFVPGRNLLLLSLAGSYAVREGASTIVTGVCQTDYSGYPDCRREFIDSLERTLDLAMPSGAGPFKIETPLMYLTKAETVLLAKELGEPCWEALGHSVTCYEGQVPGCGKCPACDLRAAGFAEAGLADPQFTQ